MLIPIFGITLEMLTAPSLHGQIVICSLGSGFK